MPYTFLKSVRYLILLLCLCGWSLTEAQAQRATGRTTRTGGGAFGGGAAGNYTGNTMVGEAMISVDPETRQIIVITDEETNQHIEQVVRNLDRPKPQVLIKVVFLEVTYRNTLDFGVEGSYVKKLGGSQSSTGLVNQVFGLAAAGATPISPGGLYQVLGQDFQVTLRALAEAGKLEVLSRPSILARNNQQALITVGQRVPIPNTSQIGANGQITTAIDYQDVGIILRVTPFISAEGLVEMIVAPEISTLTAQTVQVSETLRSPVIATRYAETVVVTPHGQTVVIGGLMENNKTDTDRKIPILGDIPLLGALFKRKIKENTKTELVIFLTPYVVADPSQLAEMTSKETEKSSLRKGAFSEQELNKFLDGLPLKDNPMPGQPPAQNGSKSNGKKNGAPAGKGR
ncbi:MAG: type II secretion system protein GspD [Verrucomicrobia bacterium]|nr:type II secretion system protein GspD [Verrucomicrobiota bacterium]